MTHVRTFQEKIEELETLLPSGHIMPFSQFKTLFGILSEFKDDGCLLLVEKFWNRVKRQNSRGRNSPSALEWKWLAIECAVPPATGIHHLNIAGSTQPSLSILFQCLFDVSLPRFCL